MNENRIQALNDEAFDENGIYVLYWMQQSRRAHTNPALEYAVRLANKQNQSVVVCFGLMADYPEANRRHFAFMLQGLAVWASRPWKERPVFGKVRYMSEDGLKRKFDIAAYSQRIKTFEQDATA